MAEVDPVCCQVRVDEWILAGRQVAPGMRNRPHSLDSTSTQQQTKPKWDLFGPRFKLAFSQVSSMVERVLFGGMRCLLQTTLDAVHQTSLFHSSYDKQVKIATS